MNELSEVTDVVEVLAVVRIRRAQHTNPTCQLRTSTSPIFIYTFAKAIR
jgi:hypothetical protein